MLRILLLLSCACATCLTVSDGVSADTSSTREAIAAGTAPARPEANEPVSAAATAARRTHRLIYSCRDGQIPMYSDRPCGEASLLRSLEVYTPAQSGRPPTTDAEPARASTRPAQRETRARTLQETAEKCAQLQQALDDIDDRMRAGYPARDAARLWQRWRDARAAVREAGC